MVNFIKIREISSSFPFLVLILFLAVHPGLSIAQSTPPPAKTSEEEVQRILGKMIQSRKIEVQIQGAKEKSRQMKGLMVKLEGVRLGKMVADYMTFTYEDPVLDLARLRQARELDLSKSPKYKVSILISPSNIENYLAGKAQEVNKKYHRLSIKFSPPYIECLFDVPAREISRETLNVLNKFIKGGKLEGYAAFQIKLKNNELYALSSKVILNHFLIPEVILREFQTKFNPFDTLPVLKPFQYAINKATVQNRYLYLTN